MLICCWAKGCKAPLYLVTNMASAEEACRLYSKRFRIETFLDCCVLAEVRHTSSRQDRLLLGEQIGKDIVRALSDLEAFMSIQDQRLHECLGLLTTRFPNGFDG
jgi:hypothetical protein